MSRSAATQLIHIKLRLTLSRSTAANVTISLFAVDFRSCVVRVHRRLVVMGKQWKCHRSHDCKWPSATKGDTEGLRVNPAERQDRRSLPPLGVPVISECVTAFHAEFQEK